MLVAPVDRVVELGGQLAQLARVPPRAYLPLAHCAQRLPPYPAAQTEQFAEDVAPVDRVVLPRLHRVQLGLGTPAVPAADQVPTEQAAHSLPPWPALQAVQGACEVVASR